MINLGGLKRKLDLRDIKLGRVQAPVAIPDSYQTDIAWLKPIWQNGEPACGSHAGTHLKMILDYFDTGDTGAQYSPEYLWIKVKQIDGYPLEEGTDMRSIFKVLLSSGVCDYSLLPNSFPDTLADYSSPAKITPEMDANAQPRIIKSYAFDNIGGGTELKQAIYQNKAVMLLLDVGETWWGKETVLPFKNKQGGHFVVAFGYGGDFIDILDSADQNVPLKTLALDYPIREVGTCVDLPDEVIKAQINKLAMLQKLVVLYRRLIALLKIARNNSI